ncbi:MAG: phospholipid carrier-dependent glycosyltransferase, partial [Chloroflexi bacterium]|nr:phospholipid carrier-dependent glycosyltransferase [Chloroflexota bacterium]
TADPAAAVYVPGDIFAWVYHARYLNAFFAGLTGVLLFWLGRRLHSAWLGLLLVALFLLDPFGVRINRRAMLETMAGLLSLAGLGLWLSSLAQARTAGPSPARSIVSGLLLGAALLTKELTFTALLALALFGGWEWWRSRRRPGRARPSLALAAFTTVAVAGFTYMLYPVWAFGTGRWDRFADVKFLSLKRLAGLIHLTGWNRPGVSVLDFLVERLVDYGSSYLLLALGGAATLFLLVAWRERATGRLLAVWGLVLYPFYAFITLAGSGNDQFFYFLLLPALILVGYTLLIVPLATPRLFAGRLALFSWLQNRSLWQGGRTVAAGFLLAVVLPFNLWQWWVTFGSGIDNGYFQLATFVGQQLPAGAAINASGDELKSTYFFPDRPVEDAATPEEARELGLRYFVLAPKDVRLHYGDITPELAGWIVARGELLFAVEGNSYGEIYLYQVDDPAVSAPGVSAAAEAAAALAAPTPFVRTYSPAETAFVAILSLILDLWSAVVLSLAAWLHWQPRPSLPSFMEAGRERS